MKKFALVGMFGLVFSSGLSWAISNEPVYKSGEKQISNEPTYKDTAARAARKAKKKKTSEKENAPEVHEVEPQERK